jgi:hypothetical protein
MIKQLKNRWNDLSYYRRFVVGVDRSKMKLYDLEDGAQNGISNDQPAANTSFQKPSLTDTPIFDNTQFGKKKKGLFDTGDLM